MKVLAIAEEQALLVGPSVMDFAQELDAARRPPNPRAALGSMRHVPESA